MPTPTETIAFPDRSFHLEIFRGGMNRMILRSYPDESFETRLEVYFADVQYMNLGMRLSGIRVTDVGAASACGPRGWHLPNADGHRVFRVQADEGDGVIVAAAVAVDEAVVALGAPSNFFMMD